VAASGLTQEEADEAATVYVWPDNWRSVAMFVELMTQWRVGMAGPVGLDYSAVAALFSIRGTSGARRRRMLDDLRVMEAAVLTKIRESK
jgi:hypothetical protein